MDSKKKKARDKENTPGATFFLLCFVGMLMQLFITFAHPDIGLLFDFSVLSGILILVSH